MTIVLYIFVAIIIITVLLFICGRKITIKRKSLSIAFDLSIMVAAFYLKDNLPILLGTFIIILAAYLITFYFAIYKKENYQASLKPTLTMVEKVEEYVVLVLCIIPLVFKSEQWLLVLLLVYCIFEGIILLIQKCNEMR